MRHLTPDQFVDLLENSDLDVERPRDAGAHAHLASCAACREQLDEVRAAMEMAASADVPEPSPLFWTHFSDRVRTAIEREGESRSSWWARVAVPAAALLAAAAVVLTIRVAPSRPQPSPAAARAATSEAPVHEGLPEIDDSLTLVAELTSSFDIDAARDAGLTARGDAEHAVTHLDEGELRELRRLIEQEMVHQ